MPKNKNPIARMFRAIQKGFQQADGLGDDFDTSSRDFSAFFKSKKEYEGFVYKCIDLRAKRLASCGINFVLKDSKGKVIDKSNEKYNLFKKPNNSYTWYRILQALESYLAYNGRAFLYVPFRTFKTSGNSTGQRGAIHYLFPQGITINYGESMDDPIKSYQYVSGGHVYDFQPNVVIPIFNFSPDTYFTNKGEVDFISGHIDNLHNAVEYSSQFFANGANPGMVFSTEKSLDEKKAELLRDRITKNHSGVKNFFKNLILDNGLKPEVINWTPKDMEIVGFENLTRDDVIALLGVPKPLLFFDAQYSNTKWADENFLKNTIIPELITIQSYINMFLFNDGTTLEFNDPLPKNYEDMKTYIDAVLNKTKTANELRKEFGDEPLIGANDLLVPANSVPLSQINTQPKPQVQNIFEDLKLDKQDFEDIKKAINDEKEFFTFSPEQDTAIAKLTEEWKTKIVNYQENIRNKFSLSFQEQKKLALKNLKNINKALDIKSSDLLDKEYLIDSSFNILSEEELNILIINGKIGADYLNHSFTEDTDRIKGYIDSLHGISRNIADTTAEALDGLMSIAKNTDELAKLIESTFDNMSEVRARTIALTESQNSSNFGLMEGYRQAGVTKKIWWTALNDRVCPYCNALHGKTISIEENYYNKGETIEGDNGKKTVNDYKNIPAPALHTNCQCFILPKVE